MKRGNSHSVAIPNYGEQGKPRFGNCGGRKRDLAIMRLLRTHGRSLKLFNKTYIQGLFAAMDHSQMGRTPAQRYKDNRGRDVASRFDDRTKYCAKIRNVMSVLFNHACRYEFFDRNPIHLVRQSAKRKAAPVVLKPAEIKTLLDGLNIRERTLVLIAASTGIRQSELFALKWATSTSQQEQST